VGLPRTGYPENTSEHWFGQDQAVDYRRHGGHPLYGEGDIVYRFNELGYRSVSFEEDAEVRIAAVGCSVGLPEAEVFHQLFAERLRQELGVGVVAWNLGLAGASNDSIVRLLHLAVPALRPHVVLVLFTHLGRREYLTPHNRYFRYAPASAPTDPVAREISGHFEALSSTYDDRLNLFRNYKSAEALLSGRSWCFSFVNPDDVSLVREHLDRRRQAQRHGWLDTARDHAHPGPATHRSLADLFWAAFVDSGGLEALR
jgi:hypothetical protein